MWRVLRVPEGSKFFVSDFEYPILSFRQGRRTTTLRTEDNNHFRTLLQHCNLVEDLDKQIAIKRKKEKSSTIQSVCEDIEEEETEKEKNSNLEKEVQDTKYIWRLP